MIFKEANYTIVCKPGKHQVVGTFLQFMIWQQAASATDCLKKLGLLTVGRMSENSLGVIKLEM